MLFAIRIVWLLQYQQQLNYEFRIAHSDCSILMLLQTTRVSGCDGELPLTHSHEHSDCSREMLWPTNQASRANTKLFYILSIFYRVISLNFPMVWRLSLFSEKGSFFSFFYLLVGTTLGTCLEERGFFLANAYIYVGVLATPT